MNALDAIKLEEERSKLAKQKKYSELKKMYRVDLAEIINLNKPIFWDDLLSHDQERGYPMYEDKISIVSRMLTTKSGSVLDVGFGNGDLLEKVSSNTNLKLYGIEISDYALKKVKKRVKGTLKKGRITKIPFNKEKFDVVVALDVLEHIPPSKTFGALQELKRVMRRGGTLIVSVPLNEGLPEMLGNNENPNGHVRIYTLELIKAELEIAGFKVKKEEYLSAFQSYYAVKNLLNQTILKNHWQPNLVIIEAVL